MIFLIVLLLLTASLVSCRQATPEPPSVEPPAPTEETTVTPEPETMATAIPKIEVKWEFIGTTSFWDDATTIVPAKFYGWVRNHKDGSLHRGNEFSDPLDPSSGRTFVGFSADGITFTIPDVDSYAQGIMGISSILLSIDGGQNWIKIEVLPSELEKSIEKWGNAFDDPVLMPSTWGAVALREGSKIILYGSYQYYPEKEGKLTGEYSKGKWYRTEIPIATIEGLIQKD